MSLVLLFNKGEAPEPDLPDLNIRDAESGLNIPVAGIQGWDNDFLQAQTLCYGPMSFSDQLTLTLNTETITYWCRRLSKVLINLEFSVSGASCELFPIFYDQNLDPILGESLTITASSQQLGGSNYIAPLKMIDTYGARKISFLPVTISSGNVYLKAAGV